MTCAGGDISVHRGEFLRKGPLEVMIYDPAGGFGGAGIRFIVAQDPQLEPKRGERSAEGTDFGVKTSAR